MDAHFNQQILLCNYCKDRKTSFEKQYKSNNLDYQSTPSPLLKAQSSTSSVNATRTSTFDSSQEEHVI